LDFASPINRFDDEDDDAAAVAAAADDEMYTDDKDAEGSSATAKAVAGGEADTVDDVRVSVAEGFGFTIISLGPEGDRDGDGDGDEDGEEHFSLMMLIMSFGP
jgi:hypothetical protein